MDIQSLKVFVAEDEVNELAKRYLPDTGDIEKLHVKLAPEGVIVTGEYPAFMMRISFETLWELSVAGPELRARLANVRVAGLPAGMLRGTLLKMMRDDLAKVPGARVEGESAILDVAEAARAHGVTLRVDFTAVRCSFGGLVLEAGG